MVQFFRIVFRKLFLKTTHFKLYMEALIMVLIICVYDSWRHCDADSIVEDYLETRGRRYSRVVGKL